MCIWPPDDSATVVTLSIDSHECWNLACPEKAVLLFVPSTHERVHTHGSPMHKALDDMLAPKKRDCLERADAGAGKLFCGDR